MSYLRLVLMFVASVFVLSACSDNDDDDLSNSDAALLRAVHLSPDAPAVDVSVAGDTVLEGVSYRQASKFLLLEPGDTALSVLVAGTATAVIEANLNLLADAKYTVLAVNDVANIEPLVIVDDNVKPAAGLSALRVVHAASSVSEVDVYVSAPEDEFSSLTPLLEDIPFKAISDELEVPAGDYRVRVTAANDMNIVYDSGTLTLVEGVEYVAVASEASSGVSPIGLTILTDIAATPFVVANDSRARVRAVHASADAPEVNISVDGAVVLSDVPFGVGSDYLTLSAGTYNIDVAAAETSTSVINADLTFEAGSDYTLAAVNSLSDIEPLVLQDDNSPPAAENVKVRLVHAATSAGSVDVYITGPDDDIATLEPTISDFNFKDDSGYLEVPAGDYRVRVTLSGTKTVAIDTGTLSLTAGQIRTAFALDPHTGSTDFGVLLLSDLN